MGKEKSGIEEFVSGLVFSAIFGFFWLKNGGWFWIFPLGFVGLVPTLNGLQKILSKRPPSKRSKKAELELKKSSLEKQILQIASSREGIITPAIAALESDLPLEEMEKALGEMAKRGYAQMEVEDSGRIIYVFPDFVKKPQ